MAPRDTWADAAQAIERIELLTRHGMTIPDIRGALKTGKVPAPLSSTGAPQAWTEALVSAGQEYIRRRGKATAARGARAPVGASDPPPPATYAQPATEGPELIAHVVATLDRALVHQAGMTPAEWERWVGSTEGKATIRQINACTVLLQVRTALDNGATASAPRLAEQLARLTASLEPGSAEPVDAQATITTVDEAALAVLDDLPALAALVGRDAILRAIGLREVHTETLSVVPG